MRTFNKKNNVMTKNELKALIDKKVQRQGTQGATSLAPILNEIIDLIPEGGEMEFITIEATLSELQNNALIPISEEIQAKLGAETPIIPVVIFVQDPKYHGVRAFFPSNSDNYFEKYWRPLLNGYQRTNESLKATTISNETKLKYSFTTTE